MTSMMSNIRLAINILAGVAGVGLLTKIILPRLITSLRTLWAQVKLTVVTYSPPP